MRPPIDPTTARPGRRPRRWRAGAAATALGLASVLVLSAPVATAGADEPSLAQDVQLFHEIDGCELHVGAIDQIMVGAEVRIRMTSDDPAVYEQTVVVGDSGVFDESLIYGDEIMAGVGGGNLLMMEVTYEDVVIDDYAASAGFPDCDGLAPLTVTIDAVGTPPAGADLQVEVRTGECGNVQNPSAVISTSTPGSAFTVWALPGSSCPSPVDALGAAVSYDPGQQTQVEAVIGAEVTVIFDFTPPPTDPTVPDPTTTTTAPDPTVPPSTVTTGSTVAAVEVLSVERAAAATPVAASPRLAG